MSKITWINSYSPQGVYIFITESESKYELEILKNGITLKRILKENNEFRKNNQKIGGIKYFSVEVGKQAFFTLEPLGEENITFRITNNVTNIIYSENSEPNILH